MWRARGEGWACVREVEPIAGPARVLCFRRRWGESFGTSERKPSPGTYQRHT